MKKLILSVVTVGAMAVGGAASAQDILGSVLPQILSELGAGRVYVDPYQNGPDLSGGSYTDAVGRKVYLDKDGHPSYVEQGGALIPYSAAGNVAAVNAPRRGDRDGDGIPNRWDRYPDDPRFR